MDQHQADRIRPDRKQDKKRKQRNKKRAETQVRTPPSHFMRRSTQDTLRIAETEGHNYDNTKTKQEDHKNNLSCNRYGVT